MTPPSDDMLTAPTLVAQTTTDKNGQSNEMDTSSLDDRAGDNCNCYLCNQCPASFGTLPDLERHLTNAHAENAEDDLPLQSPSLTLANDDLDSDEDDEEDDSPKKLKTSWSSGSSPSSTDEPGRRRTRQQPMPSTPTKQYCCRFCQKPFESRSTLNIHYTHTHRDKPQYECDLCSRVFSVKRELATHRRTHSGESTHVCTQCGKEFGTRQLLKKHWMWHTGERSHVCPHCGKAFFQKGHLTQHLMIHAGGRPHVCSLCAKTFIFKFDLNRHMKIHQERGFACDRCGRSFLKEADLKTHETICDGVPIDASEQGVIGDSSIDESSNMSKFDDDFPDKSPSIKSETPLPNGEMSLITSSPKPAVLSASKNRRKSRSSVTRQSESPTNNVDPDNKLGSLLDAVASGAIGNVVLPPPKPPSSSTSDPGQNGSLSSSSLFPPSTSSSLFPPASVVCSMQNSLNSNNTNAPNSTSATNPLFCFLCMRSFSSQAAYALHLTYVHFKGAVQQMTNGNSNTAGTPQNGMEFMQMLSQQFAQQQSGGTNSSSNNNTALASMLAQQFAAAQTQNNDNNETNNNNSSVLSSPTGAADTSTGSSGIHSSTTSSSSSGRNGDDGKCCANCVAMRERVRDVEQVVNLRDAEIAKLRDTIRRTQSIGGALGESCADFDKLWMLHSKKVFTQIQAILANLNDL